MCCPRGVPSGVVRLLLEFYIFEILEFGKNLRIENLKNVKFLKNLLNFEKVLYSATSKRRSKPSTPRITPMVSPVFAVYGPHAVKREEI